MKTQEIINKLWKIENLSKEDKEVIHKTQERLVWLQTEVNILRGEILNYRIMF